MIALGLLTPEVIRFIAAQRRKRGIGKLGLWNSRHACATAMTASAVNAWQELGTVVRAYPGMTWPPSASQMETFTFNRLRPLQRSTP